MIVDISQMSVCIAIFTSIYRLGDCELGQLDALTDERP